MSNMMVGSYIQTQNNARAYKALQNRNNQKSNNQNDQQASAPRRLVATTETQQTSDILGIGDLFAGIRRLFTGASEGEASSQQNFTPVEYAQQNARNMGELKQAAYSLGNTANHIGRKVLASTDESVATVQADFSRNGDVAYNINIQNLAENQQMESEAFDPAASTFQPGIYELILETDAGSFDASFAVAEGDTDLDALTSAVQSINTSGAGVTARIVADSGGNALRITANQSGLTGGFTMNTSTGRSAEEKLQMRETNEAREANYTVNGQRFTSDSNTVSLPAGRGATMTMLDTGFVSVGSVPDTDGVIAAAQNFAASYNTAISHLAAGTGIGARQAIGMISGTGGAAQARLAAMGIKMSANGMEVDEDNLKNAVLQNPDAVKNALSGRGSVSDSMEQGAGEAMNMTAASFGDSFRNSLLNRLLPQAGFLVDYTV